MCEMMTMTRNINIHSSSNQELKDSGIDWIGLIPADWEVKPLKSVSKITMGQSPPSDEVTDTGTTPFLQGNAEFGDEHPVPIHYCDSAPKRCSPDDILMSVRAPVGEINVADQQYAIGRGLCAITSNINNDFMRFALQKYSKDFLVYSNGSTFDAITMGSLNNFRIAVPPLNIQSDIASVLESECFKINTILKSVNHMIEDLIDLKQSIISEVVTKGLDDSVSMKDSGISWIGAIPETWDIIKVKYLGEIYSGGVDKKIREGESTFRSIHYMDVYRNSLGNIHESSDFLVISCPSDKAEKCRLLPGDILFTTSSEMPEDIGHSAMVCDKMENVLFGYHLIRFRPGPRILPSFAKYVFGSHPFRSWLSYRSYGMTRYGVDNESFANALVQIPPIDVQYQISEYLDSICSVIDAMIDLRQSIIVKIKDFKESMIYEYVTGKKSLLGEDLNASEISG